MNDPLRTIGELEQTLLSCKKTDQAGLPGLEKGRKEKEVIAAGRSSSGRSWRRWGFRVC